MLCNDPYPENFRPSTEGCVKNAMGCFIIPEHREDILIFSKEREKRNYSFNTEKTAVTFGFFISGAQRSTRITFPDPSAKIVAKRLQTGQGLVMQHLGDSLSIALHPSMSR